MSRYIDADNLMKALEKDIPVTANPIEVMASVITMLETVIAILKEQSTADVRENVRGKWKRRIVDGGWNANLVCSECGYTLMIEDGYNFCPNCGAQMMRGEA